MKMKKIRLKAIPAQPQDPLASIKAKFKRVKELRAEIQGVKKLYIEHDQLMTELLPLFIKVEPDRFTIARQVSLGTESYRLVPYFFDEKRGLVAKVWKSTPFESAVIE